MLYHTYRNTGFLHYGRYYGENMTRVESFILDTLKGFAYHSADYIRQFKETNFAFGEQQLHGALMDAFLRQGAYVLTECPIWRIYDKRKQFKKEDHSGHIDYFLQINRINYFLEIKHSFLSIDSTVINQETIKRWDTVKQQIESIRKDINDMEIDGAKEGFPVALHISPLYKQHREPYSQEQLNEKLDNIFTLAKESLEPAFLGILQLNDELIDLGKDDYDKTVYYYGCLFAFTFGKKNVGYVF